MKSLKELKDLLNLREEQDGYEISKLAIAQSIEQLSCIIRKLKKIETKDICCVYVMGVDEEPCTHGMKVIEDLIEELEGNER